MRLLASDSKMVQATVNDGPVINRSKDGTFRVPDSVGKSMVRSSEWAQVGTNFSGVRGWRCTSCGFLSVFRDRCGRCGATNLARED